MSTLSLSSDPLNSKQFLREFKLIVSANNDDADNGLDLSEFRVKFSVKRSNAMTINSADIIIYNLSDLTELQIKRKFKRVVLQAGYPGNLGVIFRGNITQAFSGRESATDTFLHLVAGDGDLAYNYALVSQTFAKGSTQSDHIQALVGAMAPKGVTAGFIDDVDSSVLPRGKTMFGGARDYLRTTAKTAESSWSIQDEKVTFVKNTTYLPGEAVVITSKTGMIGAPEQTTWGINVKCLLNPLIRTGSRIQVDEASVQRLRIDPAVPLDPSNTPAPLNADGVYNVFGVNHQGDNRGIEWYTSLVCLTIDVSTNPLNSVQAT